MRCPSSLLNGLKATPGSSFPNFTHFTIRAMPPPCFAALSLLGYWFVARERIRHRRPGPLQPPGHALAGLRHARGVEQRGPLGRLAAHRSVSLAQVDARL